jgi:hypothetical protein
VQGCDRDVAGLFQRNHPVGDLDGCAIGQVRNVGDPCPGRRRGPTPRKATGFRTARTNHDVMPIRQHEHRRAFRLLGIQPGAHTLDANLTQRMHGVGEAAGPEVEDVVVRPGADIWADRRQASEIVRVHAVVHGFAGRELAVGGSGGLEVEQPEIGHQLVNQAQRVPLRPCEIGRPGNRAAGLLIGCHIAGGIGHGLLQRRIKRQAERIATLQRLSQIVYLFSMSVKSSCAADHHFLSFCSLRGCGRRGRHVPNACRHHKSGRADDPERGPVASSPRHPDNPASCDFVRHPCVAHPECSGLRLPTIARRR